MGPKSRCGSGPLPRRLDLVLRAIVIASVALLVAAPAAGARGDDDRAEARVSRACGGGVASLRLRTEDAGIEARFSLRRTRAGMWRIVLVQERRVVWRRTVRTTPSRSFEVERTLPNLRGSDTVTARAWGPRGVTCSVTATLPG